MSVRTPPTSPAPLFALVLAGGASRRMGADKALLRYQGGPPQARAAWELLRALGLPAFISVRAGQREDGVFGDAPLLGDLPDLAGRGPVAGLLSAFALRPGAAWLAVACDQPDLNETTLRALLAARDPARVATAFRSPFDGLPEPLCAIYEPAARAHLRTWLERGKSCPRKTLLNADVLLLDAPDPAALDNVNEPEQLARHGGAA
jgi:molybdenum cofactor guanylyltransferase